MSGEIVVYKGRTNVVTVSLGIDVSAETITSQIRTQPDLSAPLVAEWVVTKPNGGADGELVLTLDNTISQEIKVNSGYMDIKRLSNGEPLPVFDQPLKVIFRGSVSA